ncbi:transferase family-domain-containing protein [Amanita rubescens]|nr:transferase family-domain-containing protein [Amanita rubescens]
MDLNDHLEPLGQQPGLKIYTQLSLCFPVSDASSHPAIINTLTNGLEQLSASFPWIAGQLVNEGSGSGDTGIFKIKPLEKMPPLVVKDYTHDASIPSMNDLRRANFPFSMLDESIIAPRKTIPQGDESVTPVFLVQANFIIGGLVLTFVGQHNSMDMTGQGQIIHLLSKACRNEEFTSEELSSGNLTRRNLIRLLDDSCKPGTQLARQVAKPSPSEGTDAPPAKCTWAYFTFFPTSLAALKSLATKSITLPEGGYISTDDTLSAFIWQSITRARIPRLSSATKSTFARAVDVRRHLGIPQTYPGIVQNMTFHTYVLQELVEEPLGSIASQLRLAVDPKTSSLKYDTRALATFLNRSPDKSTVSFVATLDLSSDIMLSSWAKLDCYELDFNLGLGKPEAVRRPKFVPVESLLYLMPKAPDGEIAVAICLRDEDMERLRADEEFGRYARYIG